MEKYIKPIKEYSIVAEEFNSKIIFLVMNVIVDKTGKIGSETHFPKTMYQLRDNVLYRLSALGWHIHKLCEYHSQLENKFRRSGNVQDPKIIYARNNLFFMFDDFIFNLMSLHDYYANLVAYFLIGETKKKICWGGFAQSAMNPNNAFSESPISKDIFNHENRWIKKLQEFRAGIIHYNLNLGNEKRKFSWNDKEGAKFELLYSIPEKLAKKMKLKAKVHDGVGVDLQLGTIEIAESSITWLVTLTDKILIEYTSNNIKKA